MLGKSAFTLAMLASLAIGTVAFAAAPTHSKLAEMGHKTLTQESKAEGRFITVSYPHCSEQPQARSCAQDEWK